MSLATRAKKDFSESLISGAVFVAGDRLINQLPLTSKPQLIKGGIQVASNLAGDILSKDFLADSNFIPNNLKEAERDLITPGVVGLIYSGLTTTMPEYDNRSFGYKFLFSAGSSFIANAASPAIVKMFE